MNNKFYTVIIALFLSSNSLIAYVQIDEISPDFKLKNSFGDYVSLSDYRGKKVILEWTNHGCPFVAKHYSTGNMQSTQNYAKDSGAIWLSIISSAPGTQGFVSSAEANDLTSSRNAIPTHVLFDSDGTVGRMYDAKTTPHMFIIDEDGRLKYQGAIDDAGGRGFMSKDLLEANNYIKKGLKEILQERSLSTPVTKPYGCSVKYAS